MQVLRATMPARLLNQRIPDDGTGIIAELRRQLDAYYAAVLREQITWSLVALMVIGVLALVLGYFAASRALSPLQRMTTTARRLSERSLHQRIDLQGPDDEVKELADTFDGMLERLDRAFDGQRRFVGNASHELRTPLAINRTLLEVALADPEASDDLKVLGRTLLATNERHERLIDGLLLLARSERELTTSVPVDLEEVCATVLGQLADEIGGAELTVERDLGHGWTRGDPVLLERLVWNLLENAVRYNTEGGELVARSGVYEGFAAIQIENSGQVIPAYEVEGLFEPFRRGQGDRLGSARGAGLGLSIVRSVAHAHGGTVAAWPRDGGGLVVTVRLPPSS
ncbi:MAG: HAMP domain-containing protein [Streptosporangiales bacterium]|nr:HAMP domain-containing protein [Streptosporangiales bacterium]